MRTLVSYDDISQPYQHPTRAQADSSDEHLAKKRKRNPRKRAKKEDTSSRASEYGDYHTSRDLTHQEIWDDSALVEAWNAATEEYEMHHGPEKAWKTEPTHKSPLWYNIPPKSTDPEASSRENSEDEEVDEEQYGEPSYAPDAENSNPIQFDTFIPRHDPTLDAAGILLGDRRGTVLSEQDLAPRASGVNDSVDEAFTRAQAAMYWAGYWTAMYHARRGNTQTAPKADHPKGEKSAEDLQDHDMASMDPCTDSPPDADNWVSTQR